MCGQRIVFDKHADARVRLRRGGDIEATVYLVCSRAVARASPALKSKIQIISSTEDAKGGPEVLDGQVIEVFADDNDSLSIFLKAAHADFLEIPRTLSVSQLYNLATFASHYDCAAILAPWVPLWASAVEGHVRGPNMARILWLFWDLGLEDLYTNLARRMGMELDTSELRSAYLFWGSTKTTIVLEAVAQGRAQILRGLLEIIRDIVEKLTVLEQKPRWSRFAVQLGPKGCRHVTRAVVESSLNRVGLWPLPEDIDVKDSVVEVYSKLIGVVSHNHPGCEFGEFWTGRIRNVFNENSLFDNVALKS